MSDLTESLWVGGVMMFLTVAVFALVTFGKEFQERQSTAAILKAYPKAELVAKARTTKLYRHNGKYILIEVGRTQPTWVEP